MPTFTQEEINLIFICNGGVREWKIDDLKNMVSWLTDDEAELRDAVLRNAAAGPCFTWGKETP